MNVLCRDLIVASLFVGSLLACSETPAKHVPVDQILQYENQSDVPARFELGGTVVEIHAPRTSELSIARRTSTAGSTTRLDLNLDEVPAAEAEFESGVRIWLAGERVKVEDGELWIGRKSYGAVSDGPVVIDADGVHTGR